MLIPKTECSENKQQFVEMNSHKRISFDESYNSTSYFQVDANYSNAQKEYIQYISANIADNFQDLSVEEKQLHKKKQQRIVLLKMKSSEAKIKWINNKIKTKISVKKTKK